MINYCQALPQVDIEKIHETSLRILDNVGIVFTYGPAKELFSRSLKSISAQC